MLVVVPLFSLCRLAALAGFSSHALYFIHGFPSLNPLGIILTHLAAHFTLLFRVGFSPALAASAAYLAALFLSITVYRLVFHRVRRFPGPLLSKVSKTLMGPWFYSRGRSHIEFEKLQRRYGDFVRVGPCELAIFDVDVVQAVYGLHTKCTKKNTAFYDHFRYKGMANLDSICDDVKHRQRRRICEKAFTPKAIETFVPACRAVVRTWLAKVDSTLGSPVDTTLFSNLIGFDNMGRIGYSKDFGTVDAGFPDCTLDVLGSVFALLSKIGTVGWLFALSAQLPSFGLVKESEKMGNKLAAERLAIESDKTHDIMKFFIEDFKSDSPKSYVNYETLVADAQGLLFAATDTVASSLAYIFYHLAKHPDTREKLLAEIGPAFSKTIPNEFTNADLGAIPYIDAVISESLRLFPIVPIMGPRVTPPEGIVVNGVAIPGLITVVTAPWCTQKDQRYFKDALDFIPERWTTRPELILDRRAFYPFSAGRRDCVGKRMAYMLLRLVIAYTLWNYDFSFAPGEDGLALVRDSKNKMLLRPGPLHCVFKKRETV